MREILFRGKRLNGDGWTYGDLSYHVHDGEVYVSPGDGYDSPDCYEVDPTTVGQYTGLQDKNGKKIFEGDIVEHQVDDDYPVYIGVVAFGKHCINDDISAFGWFVKMISKDYYGNISLYENDCLRVIGNVHDNPELLEVK